MPEHLVSWKIEPKDEYAKNLWYMRDVYKDKGMKERVKREDGVEVFEDN